jgi:hypothetical protein
MRDTSREHVKQHTGRWAVLTIAAVACAAALILWRGSRQLPSPVDNDAREELARLRAEVRSLRAENAVRLMLDGQARTRGSVPIKPMEERTVSAEAEAAGPTTPVKAELSETEIAARLDGKFYSEGYDQQWSSGAAHEADRAIRARAPSGTSVGRVECRTDLCRVETSHSSLESFRAFVDAALLGRERQIWNGGVSSMVLTQSESGVTAVSFIAREGRSVPTPE